MSSRPKRTDPSSRTTSLPRAEDFKNIAVVRLSSIGDVIMAMPAVEGLRTTYPAARITWIVETRARNILEGFPAIDAIIDFPRTRWRALWKERFGVPRSVPEIWRFYTAVRRHGFDLAIDFQGNLKSATCTFMTRAPVRVGYSREECREPNGFATNRRFSLGGQAVHRIDRDLLLVGRVGVPHRFLPPRFFYGPEDRRAGEEVIPHPGAGAPIVVLHPGTSDFMPHKRWPLESYVRLGNELMRTADARLLLSWGPGELPVVQRLARAMDVEPEILPATPTIKSLGHLLSRADLVIGGDTGPIHLAVVQGIPSVIILGPGDPRHYYPYGHPERVFYRRAPCSPCRNRECVPLVCLHDIPPNAVASRALEILRSPRHRGWITEASRS